METVEAGRYRRSISLHGHHGFLEVRLDEQKNGLAACVQFDDPRSLLFIIERARAMFDLNADWSIIAKTLRADPALAASVLDWRATVKMEKVVVRMVDAERSRQSP